MKKSIWLVLALLSTGACSHQKTREAAQLKAETPPVAAGAKCGETVFCTMEFAPHVCQFAGQSFEASNRCAAMREVRAYACAQGIAFAEDKVSCEAKKVIEEPTAANPCETDAICTREYMPHVCRFENQDFSGPNRCEALQKARRFACEKGLKWVESEASCQASEAKKKR